METLSKEAQIQILERAKELICVNKARCICIAINYAVDEMQESKLLGYFKYTNVSSVIPNFRFMKVARLCVENDLVLPEDMAYWWPQCNKEIRLQVLDLLIKDLQNGSTK